MTAILRVFFVDVLFGGWPIIKCCLKVFITYPLLWKLQYHQTIHSKIQQGRSEIQQTQRCMSISAVF